MDTTYRDTEQRQQDAAESRDDWAFEDRRDERMGSLAGRASGQAFVAWLNARNAAGGPNERPFSNYYPEFK
jgi:hypothetical protein